LLLYLRGGRIRFAHVRAAAAATRNLVARGIHRLWYGRFAADRTRTAKTIENLTAIKIPDSVNWIDATAFSSCSNLKTLEIPQNCTYKDEFHFFPGKVIRRPAGTP